MEKEFQDKQFQSTEMLQEWINKKSFFMSYGLYIGKNLTSDGHAWLAGYGDEPSSHWLEIIPKTKHKKERK